MKTQIKSMLALAAVATAAQAMAQITFYEREGFDGRSFSTERRVGDLRRFGFDDRASSAVVKGQPWEVCEGERFDGRCIILRPGSYPTLAAMGLNDRVTSVREVKRGERIDASRYAPAPVAPRIVFYERDGFGGRSLTVNAELADLDRSRFDDRASSVEVIGGRWEVCEDSRYRGRCTVLRPGRYPSLQSFGMQDTVSSARPVAWSTRVEDSRYAPMPGAVVAVAPSPQPVAVFDPRRRNGETLYTANVTAVKAVVGPPEQRCWVDREQVAAPAQSNSNVGGAVVGAVIGGILGHQVGGGRGKDLATVGGAIAGGALGSQVGRANQPQTTTQDVKRCTTVPPQARADLWDVTYNFRGQDHQVQMTAPPGATVTVNERGEPRV